MKHGGSWLGALVAACCGSLAPAQTLITNGGFESQPNFGAGASYNGAPDFVVLTGSQLPGWTILPNHSVTVHSTTMYPYITGSYSVNMDGEAFYSGHNADFYQDFATTAGVTYQLTFDWQGWTNNGTAQLEVLVINTGSNTNVFDGLYSFSSTLGHETATFTGTGDAFRLEIRESPESGFNDNRFMVDNFVVTAIPEPTAAALVGGGVALAGALLRRRSARAIR